MKKILLCLSLGAFLFSCTSSTDKAATMDSSAAMTSDKSVMDLPYTASYSSSWSQDVSDADLKTVLMSYKNWEDANFTELAGTMGDTATVDMSSGAHLVLSNADLMKMWSTYRDSLSSVKINMAGWEKMYSTDKKEAYIVTWYDETDTYKDGRVDSATYHDINMLKNGKIVWYSQYKRPKK